MKRIEAVRQARIRHEAAEEAKQRGLGRHNLLLSVVSRTAKWSREGRKDFNRSGAHSRKDTD